VLNDLNGLIYYEGEYHLFAQRWAKCWIHALSRDLIHWTELEPAFWEEKLDSGVQSGTCVIDYNNTSGLAPNKATLPMSLSGRGSLGQCRDREWETNQAAWMRFSHFPDMPFSQQVTFPCELTLPKHSQWPAYISRSRFVNRRPPQPAGLMDESGC